MLKLPKHIALSIEHNEHKANYQTVAEYIEYSGYDFKDAESKQKCIDTNELWVCHWYPKTPVGFYVVAAPTFEELMELINEQN